MSTYENTIPRKELKKKKIREYRGAAAPHGAGKGYGPFFIDDDDDALHTMGSMYSGTAAWMRGYHTTAALHR